MSILLLGANGQVGSALRKTLRPMGTLIECTRDQADLEDAEELRSFLVDANPSLIVNAAAYTAVDRAEDEPDRAKRINCDAVEVLAQYAARTDALLVHYSTDYVFDGEGDKPYVETDDPNPQSVYGKTKLDGERAIQSSGCEHFIFRTSWVYSDTGNNFVKSIRRLATEREELTIVDDQIGAPTSANLIASVTADVLSQHTQGTRQRTGLYHLTASGETSWYGFAQHFLEADRTSGARIARVLPIPSESYPTKATRPKNSRLDTRKLRDAFGVELPDWRVDVDSLLATMRLQETL